MSFQETGEIYLTAPQLRARFGGRSDVWLWRLLKDERANFPKPVMVRRYRSFRLSEIEAWEKANRAKPKEASNAASTAVRSGKAQAASWQGPLSTPSNL